MNFRGQNRKYPDQGLNFGSTRCSVANYSTSSRYIDKNEMKVPPIDPTIYNRFKTIPDPLRKNLADTIVTAEEKKEKNPTMSEGNLEFYYEPSFDAEEIETPQQRMEFPSLSGITNFFSNFFGAISGAVFHKRAKSPVSQYYDCFDQDTECCHQMSPEAWQTSKFDDLYLIGATDNSGSVNGDMNTCRTAVAHCESKLNVVRSLLPQKHVQATTRLHRRPRKVFVEPGSVSECFEDAICTDEYVNLPNEECLEYVSVGNNQNSMYCEIDAVKTKTELSETVEVPETEREKRGITVNKAEVDINKQLLPQTQSVPPTVDIIVNDAKINVETKEEIISSCEDKMARLKLLLEKRKTKFNHDTNSKQSITEEKTPTQKLKPPKSVPIEISHDKRFKNPCRLSCDKRKQARMRKNIEEDALFAVEIEPDELSSSANSLSTTPNQLSESIPESEEKDYFDELKGRFHPSSATDSEDSFQIVFSDSPKTSRMRRPSDCESEDSLIVFEDSPSNCYTTNDVFGDQSDEESENSDPESEVSDEECENQLTNSFSKTFGDLTDDNLYTSEGRDVVDFAAEVPVGNLSSSDGVLMNETKKLNKTSLPKKVTFSTKPPKVHVMRVWAFAARQARAGHWERHALDRERFRRRIADVDMAVSWVLKPQHRSRVMFQRFMPWWNAQKRKELAEKKQRDEEEKKMELESAEIGDSESSVEDLVTKEEGSVVGEDLVENGEGVDVEGISYDNKTTSTIEDDSTKVVQKVVDVEEVTRNVEII